MQRKHEVRSAQTLSVINGLLDRGIEKIAVIMRHSDRHFTTDARMEPFMCLNDDGKGFALDMGKALPKGAGFRLFSSFFGRCIETAYLLDKGYCQSNDQALPHNQTSPILAPFYIKDIEDAIGLVEEQGSIDFIRNWFDGKIDETVMENPERTADTLAEFLVERLKEMGPKEIALCVSHDWNLFPLKEFKLGLKHETAGDVGYLEGVVIFEEDGKIYITNHQSDPVLL
ncbi:MAG: histidine phosphatase family protein [Desulfobacterales bacterium]|nr:histidine phosphatase family protein [Desulfobacterales bacterium]